MATGRCLKRSTWAAHLDGRSRGFQSMNCCRRQRCVYDAIDVIVHFDASKKGKRAERRDRRAVCGVRLVHAASSLTSSGDPQALTRRDEARSGGAVFQPSPQSFTQTMSFRLDAENGDGNPEHPAILLVEVALRSAQFGDIQTMIGLAGEIDLVWRNRKRPQSRATIAEELCRPRRHVRPARIKIVVKNCHTEVG